MLALKWSKCRMVLKPRCQSNSASRAIDGCRYFWETERLFVAATVRASAPACDSNPQWFGRTPWHQRGWQKCSVEVQISFQRWVFLYRVIRCCCCLPRSLDLWGTGALLRIPFPQTEVLGILVPRGHSYGTSAEPADLRSATHPGW